MHCTCIHVRQLIIPETEIANHDLWLPCLARATARYLGLPQRAILDGRKGLENFYSSMAEKGLRSSMQIYLGPSMHQGQADMRSTQII